MKRRTFLKTGGTAAVLAGLLPKSGWGRIPAHNWEKYDFGSGPPVKDRLYQGPFPQYEPEAFVPGSDPVMATTPSREIVPNYGMGLTVYVAGDIGPPRIPGESLEKSLEDLIKLPFAQKIYIRPNWRDVQKRPGRLDFPDFWKITFDLGRKYNKQIGFRIMLENPDIPELGPPDFVTEKVPYVKLKGEWRTSSEIRRKKEHKMPRYDHPAYQAAFRELNELLAAELNGNPLVEYMDTMMYGFWGEGHTWPFDGHPFPDDITAEKTWIAMMETQLEIWSKTPLVTNTQPDWSRVGNSEMVDRTVRSHNWLRTDTIFIENTQIEALSNRPPWIAAVSEVGITPGDPDKLRLIDGITFNEFIISHVIDVGANYWSLWNWHNISARNILSYYEKYPEPIDEIARRIGYRVRPSWIWHFEKEGHPGLVLGMVNDGIAGVPGVLRLTVFSADGSVRVSGCLDPGYPKPQGVRQAMFILPRGVDWKGLRVKAELEVKGVLHPVNWACAQKTNPDGSLTLQPNLRRG
ncbi:MAG: hypothetical protein Kow0042_00370 [Calditrichia bacterium]